MRRPPAGDEVEGGRPERQAVDIRQAEGDVGEPAFVSKPAGFGEHLWREVRADDRADLGRRASRGTWPLTRPAVGASVPGTLFRHRQSRCRSCIAFSDAGAGGRTVLDSGALVPARLADAHRVRTGRTSEPRAEDGLTREAAFDPARASSIEFRSDGKARVERIGEEHAAE